MALSIVGDCRVSGAQGVVTVEGDTPAEVSSVAAKAGALQAAMGRLNKPGISNQSGPYAVGPDGNAVEVIGADGTMRGAPPGARYRQDFQLQAGM